jgi:hypothetical protein
MEDMEGRTITREMYIGQPAPVKNEEHQNCNNCGRKGGRAACINVCQEWMPEEDSRLAEGDPDFKSHWKEVLFCCRNNGMIHQADNSNQMDIIAFIRDLAQRANDLKMELDCRDMWSKECVLMCGAIEDLAGLPHEPHPGWTVCIEKLRQMVRDGRFTKEQIELWLGKLNAEYSSIDSAIRFLNDPQDGIAAVTKRKGG